MIGSGLEQNLNLSDEHAPRKMTNLTAGGLPQQDSLTGEVLLRASTEAVVLN